MRDGVLESLSLYLFSRFPYHLRFYNPIGSSSLVSASLVSTASPRYGVGLVIGCLEVWEGSGAEVVADDEDTLGLAIRVAGVHARESRINRQREG